MFKSLFVVATLIASFSSAAPAEDTKPELERREPTYYSSSSYYGYRPSSYYSSNNNNYGYTSYYKPTTYKSSGYSDYNSYKPKTTYGSYYLQKRDTIPEAKPELERREPTYYSSSSYYGYRPSSYGYSNNNNYGYTSYYKPTTYKSSGYSDYNSYKPKTTYGSYYLQKRDTIPELQRREPTYYSSSSYYGYRPSSYGYSNNNNYGYTSYYKPTTYKSSSSGYSSYNSYKPTYGSYYLQKRDNIPEAKPELERRQDDDDDDE